MKTFAQLKKDLQCGTMIKTILNNCRPEKTGEIRKIGKVQTNAIAFELANPYIDWLGHEQKYSWLYWDKASCYEYDDNIFKVYHFDKKTNEKTLHFIYEILKGEQA